MTKKVDHTKKNMQKCRQVFYREKTSQEHKKIKVDK